MFVLGNFIEALAQIFNIGLTTYMWMIIIRAILSWFSPDPYNPIVVFLYRATEPVLYRVRKWIPLGNIGVDVSPIVVILVIVFLQSFLVKTLFQLAINFK